MDGFWVPQSDELCFCVKQTGDAFRQSPRAINSVCTCATGKPFPKIVPIGKLDILLFTLEGPIISDCLLMMSLVIFLYDHIVA